MNNRFLLALATLVGTIIGAGIFGLPYVISKSGVLPGLFYFVVLGGVVLLLPLMFGEIALRTKEKRRLIGYAEVYLGGWAKKVATISTVVGIVGALLAYIILAGDFLTLLLSPMLGGNALVYSLAFWLFFSLLVLRGIQTIARVELLMNGALFAAIALIFLFALPHIQLENFPVFDAAYLFLPYGVVFFAFTGLSAIPEIAELFKGRNEKRRVDNLIEYSSILVGLVDLFFVIAIVGVTGGQTSSNALGGVVPIVGTGIGTLGVFFGLLAVATSFLVLGDYLKNSLRYDFRLSYAFSVAIALGAPLVLFLLGLREFILVIGIIGAFMAVLDGGLVVLIYRKAARQENRTPEYRLRIPQAVAWAVLVFLLAGALAEILIL